MSIKVIIVGKYQSGKTCIINRIVTDSFNSNANVTTSCIVSTYYYNGKQFQFNDISGDETFQNVVNTLFRNAKIAIIVFSINSIESYNEVDKWYEKIKEILNVQDKNDSNYVSIILVGTKSDLNDIREVSYEQGLEKAEFLGNFIKYIEVSSKSGENIHILKDELIECANLIQNSSESTPIHIDNQKTSNDECC